MLEMPLDRDSKVPLYQQIALHLRRMIEIGALPEGYKLPGTRQLASDLGVSRTTINAAMAILEKDGYVKLIGKSGCYVHCRNAKSIRQNCSQADGIIWDLSSGLPDKSLMPMQFVYKPLREFFLTAGEYLLLPAPLAGLPELREALVKHAALRGIPARSSEVLVTAGGLEALSILIAVLKDKGVRRIFVEKLTYPAILELASRNGLRACPICLEDPASSLERASIGDAVYLIPSFHNPTGRTLSLVERNSILTQAKRKSLIIIEDDTYGELRYGKESVPALKAMEGAENVAYLGSFSQALFPGFRISYLLLPENLMRPCLDVKKVFYGSVSSLVQYFVLAFINEGGLYEALEFLRNQISLRMKLLCEGLRKTFPEANFEMPLGGIYLWLNLPGLKGSEATLRAKAGGISVVPGRIFSVEEEDLEAVRLSVSSLRSCDISAVLFLLRRLWKEELLP
ncbi:MAG: PLP-dependent aminotransferase family protein [Acetomicrobium sp.]